MTDYSWRAGSQADETAIVLKNCVGNACLLTQARLLGHMPQLTMDRNKHLRSYPAIHRQQFRPPGIARDMIMFLPVGRSFYMPGRQSILDFDNGRSEERSVGKESVTTYRTRWTPFH